MIRDAWTIALTILCILFKVMVDDTLVSGEVNKTIWISLFVVYLIGSFLFLCRSQRRSLMS